MRLLWSRRARNDLESEMLRDLPGGHASDVSCGLANGASDIGGDARGSCTHLRTIHLQGRRRTIEPFGESRQRNVALTAHTVNDGGDSPIEKAIGGCSTRQHTLQCSPVS